MNKQFITLMFLMAMMSSVAFGQTKTYEVPLSGNAYVTSSHSGASIRDAGLTSWGDASSKISTYVRFNEPQKVSLYIKGSANGKSKISVSFLGKKKNIKIDKGNFETLLGKYDVKEVGYQPITLQGVSKDGKEFATIESFVIKTDNELTYVSDFSHYWGRRGPSVHLKYTMPEEDVEWFYNEVTVPEGEDVIGSYYMANGYGEGYFGIQCNSADERRVLFSVWSPFDTQDPKLIPDSLKIKMLRRGEGVHIGEFGNEGSGGQSYLKYNWKAGNTYKFLTQVKPDGKGNTVYTGYFYATDENRWRLISSFMRPKTNTHYKGAHSFLENFSPNQGYLTRKVLFSNQWFKTVAGDWVEGNEAAFTYDATARAKARLDYQGGYNKASNSFYLQNCGFFNESTEYLTKFHRKYNGKAPVIDFEELEKL